MYNNSNGSSFTDEKTSEVLKRLKVSPIKALYKYYTPTAVNLAGGLPMESCFPYQAVDVRLQGGEADSYTLTAGKDLFLNYHRGSGLPQLRDWVHNHVKQLHSPHYDFDLTLSIGSTDAWSKLVSLLSGDCILFDEYVYGASVAACEVAGKKAIGVVGDDDGMCPNALRNTVMRLRERGQEVHVLYTIPTGHNPLGITLSAQRKKDLYKVCQDLDLIIVEDDAYYYLYFPDFGATASMPGVRELPQSFLSIDTDQRVVRFDSTSKFIAPGIRVGWVTAPPDFIEKYCLLQEISSQFPSGVSQSMLIGLLEHWQESGLHSQLQNLQSHYSNQRRVLVEALQQHFLDSTLCRFTIPTGGMFIWMEFPALQDKGVTTFDLFEALAAADVIIAPGSSFHVPTLDVSSKNSSRVCARVCFASASSDHMKSAISKMAEVVDKLMNK